MYLGFVGLCSFVIAFWVHWILFTTLISIVSNWVKELSITLSLIEVIPSSIIISFIDSLFVNEFKLFNSPSPIIVNLFSSLSTIYWHVSPHSPTIISLFFIGIFSMVSRFPS